MKTLLAALALLASFATHAQSVTCTDAKQCEVMWSKAQQAIPMVSRMRIRLLTSDRIETYAPPTSAYTGAIVTKVPQGDGYVISLEPICGRMYTAREEEACRDIDKAMKSVFAEFLTAK